VEGAQKESARLMKLVSDLLDVARMEAGKFEIVRERTDFKRITDRAIRSVLPLSDQRNITIEDATGSVELEADEDRLIQVMVNLLSNAIKFSPAGSTISIHAPTTRKELEVKVKDQGRGIPAQHLEAIFERFWQVEATDARQRQGTGLGLAICKTIIEGHDGCIGAESIVGEGSTFWFRLPLDTSRNHVGSSYQPEKQPRAHI